LNARGVDTGLVVLPPGERWATRIVIKVSALEA
jgi:hypothetical protein